LIDLVINWLAFLPRDATQVMRLHVACLSIRPVCP